MYFYLLTWKIDRFSRLATLFELLHNHEIQNFLEILILKNSNREVTILRNVETAILEKKNKRKTEQQ